MLRIDFLLYRQPVKYFTAMHACHDPCNACARRNFARASKQVLQLSHQGAKDDAIDCGWKLSLCPLVVRRRGRINVSPLWWLHRLLRNTPLSSNVLSLCCCLPNGHEHNRGWLNR